MYRPSPSSYSSCSELNVSSCTPSSAIGLCLPPPAIEIGVLKREVWETGWAVEDRPGGCASHCSALGSPGVGGEGGQMEGPRLRPLSGCIAEAQGSTGLGSVDEKDPVVSVGLRRKCRQERVSGGRNGGMRDRQSARAGGSVFNRWAQGGERSRKSRACTASSEY